MERTRRLRQEGLAAARRSRSSCGRASSSSTSTRDAAPLAPTLAALRAVPRALRPRRRGVPRHVHAHRPAVELEGDVRELQRRLPRQPAAPHIQDFCPSELAAFPVPWDDASNVIFRTNGYTHIDGGFNATTKALLPVFPELTEEERWRSTFALDAADAVPRHRARPGLLLHRHARRRPTRSTSRSATCSTRARSSTRCSTTCSR